MNNWAFTGNLGRDAESRFTAGGDAVVSFSVAVKSGFGDKAVTSWVNCSLWGKRGESVAPYLKKGTLVGITGEAMLREWSDKDQQKRVSLDVRVNDLTLLGGKPGGEAGDRTAKHAKEKSDGYAPASDRKPSFDDLGDDIPF